MANETKLNMLLQVRRDNVFNSNHKLEKGEPGFEISTNTLKLGDGEHVWSQLDIVNKSHIDTLISTALSSYYTKDEIDEFISDLESAIGDKLDSATYNEYVATRTYTDTQIDTAISTAKSGAEQTAASALAEYNTNTIDPIAADVATIKGDYLTSADKEELSGAISDLSDTLTNDYVTSETFAAELDKKVNVESYTADKATFATKTELGNVDAKFANYKTAADQKVIDDEQDRRLDVLEESVEDIDGRLGDVEDVLANVTNVMDFVGAVEALPTEFDGYHKGDVIVVTAGDDAGKEYVFDGTKFVEFGYADGNAAAISDLQDRMGVAEGDIAKKLDSSVYNSYIATHSYTDETIDGKIKSYSVAATSNPLEFTVTETVNGASEVIDTVTLVAPTVDTGIMSVEGTTDDVVVETSNGAVTVAHKEYSTGTLKDAAHNSETDPSFITGITISNGHVTGATVQNLATVLANMTFIFDGGNSGSSEN